MEKEKFYSMVRDVMDYSLGSSTSAERVVDDWATNKEHFYKLFGNKTMISTDEVVIDVENQEEISIKYGDFRIKSKEYVRKNFPFECLLDF